MITCRSRRVIDNGNAFKITLPRLWVENVVIKPGDTLRARWNEKTGELVLKKVAE